MQNRLRFSFSRTRNVPCFEHELVPKLRKGGKSVEMGVRRTAWSAEGKGVGPGGCETFDLENGDEPSLAITNFRCLHQSLFLPRSPRTGHTSLHFCEGGAIYSNLH
ncbi:hypothetical protein CDAR_117841 [Caerostris darwini]|uniref:Uncharacterized protein n=1 Tax=Caerostris darwini TaxID=1538125 RepID=A0AAV4PZM9_9ARAC|nr:hypothetical protein CDAR_117841 [Caerostris darwini]